LQALNPDIQIDLGTGLQEKSRTCQINCLILQLEEWFDHPRALAEKFLDMEIKNRQPLGVNMFAGALRALLLGWEHFLQ
jgi:hypothetical protein